MAMKKLKRHKSTGSDQIPAKLIKTGGKKFALKFTNLLNIFGKRRSCPRSGRCRSRYLCIGRVTK